MSLMLPIMFNVKDSINRAVHLGCAFAHDQHGILYIDPNQYIKRMKNAYKHRFDDKPDMRIHSLLDQGYHPELDTSDFINEVDTKICQSLIVAMQWAISFG